MESFPSELLVIEQEPTAGTSPFIARENADEFDTDDLKDALRMKCARYVLAGVGDINLGPSITFAKKRGRPKKIVPTGDAPKRRGRPPKALAAA